MDGRTALVTGAAQGLGEAIAAELAGRGARVVCADLDGEGAERVAGRLGARAAQVDVRDPVALRAAIDAADPDVLVNNAARTLTTPLWDIEPDEWDAVLETNLRSVFVACQHAGPRMRERGWGRIVNLTSIAGQAARTTGAHYAASKAGIVIVTKMFAAELAPHGVTVNAVAPAAVRTPAMDAMPPERVEAMQRTIPVGRVGRVEEVAAVVALLASDEAAYVTGATYDVNGGLLMR